VVLLVLAMAQLEEIPSEATGQRRSQTTTKIQPELHRDT
jgi:hypothetical protein